jgi:agmatinase
MSFKFDPSATISSEFGIFGIPITEQQSQVVLLPVPWEVTTSYGKGAADGPTLIRQASEQIDLFDRELGKAFEAGYFMRPVSSEIRDKNDKFKAIAQEVIALSTQLSDDVAKIENLQSQVNQASQELTQWVYTQSKDILDSGKLLGLVGGDHSTPLGAIKAVIEKYGEVGILHFDAHADLREAYQGFEQSHASIMYNVVHLPQPPKKLVQVGIRDFSEEEYKLSTENPRIKTFFDQDLKDQLHNGKSWANICEEILNELPKNIYISFDIDGLDPRLCPHTGTPVPGGLSLDQVFFLFKKIVQSGRKIVAFDLNEVSSGGLDLDEAEWDGNVGSRLLYKLCGWLVRSQSEKV